jgi:hypothetical protein
LNWVTVERAGEAFDVAAIHASSAATSKRSLSLDRARAAVGFGPVHGP